MVEAQIQLDPMGVGSSSESGGTATEDDEATRWKWWIEILVYTFLVLAGQSAALLLGRLYFDQGGKSTWMSTLVQVAGFPALIPLYYVLPQPQKSRPREQAKLKICAVYTALGLIIALDSWLYSIGLLYLPVSTYSLICASQLGFNVLFAFFLRTQNFTPYIVNSVVLLTLSSTLLVFQKETSTTDGSPISKPKYILGFVCTVGASALYGLLLPLTQIAFQRVLKRHDFTAVLDLLVYQYLAATCAVLVGLFASGDWKTLKGEMQEYKLGRVSYVMTLTWIALSWQIFSIGSLKLIIQVSSLFSDVISTLGLPIVPVLAVFLFHDTMDGIKAVAMVLALWGFISYAYQCFIDNQNTKSKQLQSTTAV